MALLGFQAPARNDLARVFLFPDGVFKAGANAVYASCVSVDALAQDRGDVTNIECPSPTRYGEFEVVGTLPGELSRMTTTLTGHLSRTDISTFYKLFIQNCKFDLHLHFGLCQAPNNFAQFDKAMVFEDVNVTAFSTDPLVALQSGDRAVVNESIDISIGRFYEIVNLEYNERGTVQTSDGDIVAVAVCDLASCGSECDVNSDGCQRMFAASDDGVLYYSEDAGQSWGKISIAGADPDGSGSGAAPVPSEVLDMVCWGNDILILDDNNTLWTANRDDIFDGNVSVFGHFTTSIPNDGAFAMATNQNQVGVLVGDGGYIALFSDMEGGNTLVDAGFTTANDLNDVHIAMDGTIVAVGESGTVVYSVDGETWYNAPNSPESVSLTAVVAKSRTNWIVGTGGGKLWATDNSGRTWTRIAFPGWASHTAPINEIALATTHVLYMVSDDTLFRSIDGGNSWMREPNSKRAFPTNQSLLAVAACYYDPNFVLVGGSGSGGTSGILINGTTPT